MNLEQVFILDSFAMMAYLGAEPGGERINDILKKAAATEIRLDRLAVQVEGFE